METIEDAKTPMERYKDILKHLKFGSQAVFKIKDLKGTPIVYLNDNGIHSKSMAMMDFIMNAEPQPTREQELIEKLQRENEALREKINEFTEPRPKRGGYTFVRSKNLGDDERNELLDEIRKRIDTFSPEDTRLLAQEYGIKESTVNTYKNKIKKGLL